MHLLQFSKAPGQRFIKLIPVLVLMLTPAVAGLCQTLAGSQAEELKKLDFLLGEWKGTGWAVNWDGSRGDEFSQKTKVEAKAGGSALRIKDERSYKTPGVSHSSTLEANISYDDEAKIYRWRGETSFGRKNPLEAKLIDVRTFQYGIPFTVTVALPNGARRTTIKMTESGEWHETLDVWKIDRWYRVEESVLKRVK
jgi:hypothetical protein